jgi:hypothetical protein
MFKVERRVWGERKVHPCRWIKIILNFKFQVQASRSWTSHPPSKGKVTLQMFLMFKEYS